MAKTLAEIEAALAVDYDGPVEDKGGFSYIPWFEAVKVANRIFGVDGYDVQVIAQPHREGEGYTSTVRVTVYPSDGRPFFRDGVGNNELSGDGARATDTAVKGSPSDATNRALCLFGPAFGLSLRKGRSAAGASGGQYQQRQQPNNQGEARGSNISNMQDRRPSEKQMNVFLKNGFSEEQIDGLSFKQWKPLIDAIFNNEAWPIQPANVKSKPAPKQVTQGNNALKRDEDDDEGGIPF